MTQAFTRHTRCLGALLALALAPLGQAQVIDTLGGTTPASGVGRAKGNSYEIVSATTLIEAEFMLEFTGVQTLRFTVHSSPTEFGTYTEVFQRSAQVTGTGLDYYSSGPVSVPLVESEHYIVAVSWDGSMGYFYGTGDTVPVSFGNHTQIRTPARSVPPVVGQTRSFQAWHRDAVGGAATSNFTSGLAVVFL